MKRTTAEQWSKQKAKQTILFKNESLETFYKMAVYISSLLESLSSSAVNVYDIISIALIVAKYSSDLEILGFEKALMVKRFYNIFQPLQMIKPYYFRDV